jgi:hypothetical protein
MDELCSFDPIKLAEPVVQVLQVEGVGDVKYAPLNMQDYLDLKDHPKETEEEAYDLGLEMAHRMLSKAYPGLTKDMMLAWPPKTLNSVTSALLDLEDFRGRKPESGSG